MDLDGDGVGGGLAREALDEEVGEDLLWRPLGGVAFGDGAGSGRGEVLVAGRTLGDRQQGGEVGHAGVGLGGLQDQVPVAAGLFLALERGGGVLPLGGSLGFLDEFAVAEESDPLGQGSIGGLALG